MISISITILCFIFLAPLFYFCISESVIRTVYGPYLKDSKYLDILVENKEKNMRINSLSITIIRMGDIVVYALDESIICKYYISNIGLIPRWSKMHKFIKQSFAEEIENESLTKDFLTQSKNIH